MSATIWYSTSRSGLGTRYPKRASGYGQSNQRHSSMIASAPQKMRSPEMKAILRCTSSSPAPNRRLCESAAQVLRGGGEASGGAPKLNCFCSSSTLTCAVD